jgi:hypothetical protein
VIGPAGAAALALVWSVVAGGSGGAPALALDIQGCLQLDQARLRELVDIEMATVRATGATAATGVRVACAGERVSIDVASPPSHAELDLAAAAEGTRLRLLALTITELVAPGAAPPADGASPPPGKDEAGADLHARAAEPPRARRFRLHAETSARRMGKPSAWLGGLALGASREVADFAALALDLRVETGQAAPSLARVDWQQLVVTGAVALGVTGERWAFHALPGWSVGFARLSGRPAAGDARGETFSGAWSGPSLALRARRALGRVAFVSLEVAGGAVTRRVVGLVDGQTTLFAIEGPWTLAGLAAGFAF